MVRHQVFYEALASLEQDSVAWETTLAGLAVIRLVDGIREDPDLINSDWTGFRGIVNRVTAIHEGSAMRRPLMKIVEQIQSDHENWKAIASEVFAYGRTLDLEGNWNLAVDVFSMVAEIAREERNPELVIQATTALGGSARRSGEWDRSAHGYAEAAHMAETLGDKASGLTVRIGTANTHLARGNLPAAQMILDEVLKESEKEGLERIAALSLHTSASIAHLKGDYAVAATMGYEAFRRTDNPSARDSVMADIAAALVGLGMHASARDAHMIISMTSRYQWVRWQASINLMELAALDKMESAFFDYAGQLRNAALDPRLRSYFLLYYGQGCITFGRAEEGRHTIEDALNFSSQQKIHQVTAEAEAALESIRRGRKEQPSEKRWTEQPDDRVLAVASALADMRATALSSSEWSPPEGP